MRLRRVHHEVLPATADLDGQVSQFLLDQQELLQRLHLDLILLVVNRLEVED